MKKKILYIGLDVHKKSIDVAITGQRTHGKVRSYGKIDGTLEALDKLVDKLKSPGSDLHFVYEAGPCGYPIYRHLTAKGHSCSVVAPSLVPKQSGDADADLVSIQDLLGHSRIKTTQRYLCLTKNICLRAKSRSGRSYLG